MQGQNILYEMEHFQGVSYETLDYLWSKGRIIVFQRREVILRAKEPIEWVYV